MINISTFKIQLHICLYLGLLTIRHPLGDYAQASNMISIANIWATLFALTGTIILKPLTIVMYHSQIILSAFH